MKGSGIWLSEEIEGDVRRIKEVEETTDLTVLRSEKLLWELKKEKTEAQLDVWRRGLPSVECESPFDLICRAMGIEPYSFPSNVDQTTRYAEYKTILERAGFPEKGCERTLSQLAMCEIGELPGPHLQLISGQSCDSKLCVRRCQATHFNIPGFYVDVPLNEDDRPNLDNLNYIADQLGECIEWIESKLPGVKYDEDRHIEIQELDAIGQKYRFEAYQLLKHVPCPVGPLDHDRRLVFMCEPVRYPNMQKAIEFLRICRDEIGERVASGHCPEERLRLVWSGMDPKEEVLSVRKLMLERKVALPLALVGNIPRCVGLRCRPMGEVSEYGIKLSPLQEDARKCDSQYWSGPAKRWVNGSLDFARDLGAHGIINYLTLGCTPMRGTGSMLAERSEKELGIPTLNMEGRLDDRGYMSQERFEEILSPFIDKCFDRAGKPRQ